MPIRHRLNWKRSLPHINDPKYRDHREMKGRMRLAKSTDLQPLCAPVVDQGDIGSCTGNAIASGAVDFLQMMDLRLNVPPDQAPQEFVAKTFEPSSRLFVYYCERVIEGDPTQDAGAMPRDGIWAVQKWGVCREASWQYNDGNALVKPSQSAYDEAIAHKDIYHYSIDDGDLSHMKRCLMNGFPFILGFTVYDSFMTQEVADTGIMPVPQNSEQVQGGHCVTAVGYDDSKQMVKCRNSWGTDWGLGGYFWMPYACATNVNMTSDLWTIRRHP